MKVLHRKDALFFECPARRCGLVRIPLTGVIAWTWNGSFDAPTVNPSVKITWTWGDQHIPKCCHFDLRDGKMIFHGDCTHELKGQTVDLPDLPGNFDLWFS